MTDTGRGGDATHPSTTVGERLRAMREAQDLSLSDVAVRTRVPLRHLEAIEQADYAGLPSATYAVGFVRAYARAVGADEVPLARDVRAEVARSGRTPQPYQPYEVADPTRVPSRLVVIVAAGLALAVLILAILWFATGVFRGGEAPQNFVPPVVAPVPAAAQPDGAPSNVGSGGQVTLTARNEVWLRVYDANDQTLYTGTMARGERFDVPRTAVDPKINVGRPDQLLVTLNGSAAPALGDGSRPIKDVAVSAAAVAARLSGTPAEAVAPSPPREAGGAPPAFQPPTP